MLTHKSWKIEIKSIHAFPRSHLNLSATMTSLSVGDTVKSTHSTNSTRNGECSVIIIGNDPHIQCTRKRRRLDLSTTATDIPQKTKRRNEQDDGCDANIISVDSYRNLKSIKREKKNDDDTRKFKQDVSYNVNCLTSDQRKR